MKRTLLYAMALLTSALLHAQNFNLVKEINTTSNSGSQGSAMLQRVGTTVYFVANNGINGNELWKTDGTAAGTMMVKDINPGAGNTGFINFTTGDGLLFFVADDGVHGFEMWRSDGTEAGTFMLYDGFSGCTFCENRLFFHNGYLYFAGDDGTTGAELWKTDGTVAGTVLVKDIFPGPTMSHPAPTSGVNYTFVPVGNDLYFSAVDALAGRELFKTDGTAAGTVMVKDIFPGATSSISTVNHKAAAFNGKLYFAANDGVNGLELWATDGTEAGTYRVKDIVAGSGSSQPNNLIAFNGALYFTASSTNNAAPDLYKTDGTEAGTVMVRNLVADGITLTIGNSAVVDQFTVANNKLFFRGTGPTGIELYATDGTTAGTGIVKDIYPGINSISPNGMFAFNNNLYFQALDVEMPTRTVLYKTDGTSAGTVTVMDAESGGSLAMVAITMTSTGGRLYFWGNTNENGVELWSTDGTNANTTLVKDIVTAKIGTITSGANLFGSVVHNGYYYFAAVDDTHGGEIWKSDGTTAGTVMIKDIWPGKASSNPNQPFVYNGAVYFSASNGVNGTELWKTDGTEAGTVMVADINTGNINSNPNRFFIANNYLYFIAYHSSYGTELWRSDGTAAGTTMVVDFVTGPGTGIGSISDVVSFGNNAYAIMSIGAGNVLGLPTSTRLFKVDGVANTISEFSAVVTTAIDLGVVGNTLYVTGRNSSSNTLLWKSDNGGALIQVKLLSTTSTNAIQLTNAGGKLYFSASNGTAAGMEPWISDGTETGTFMLKDINPGANPSTPYQFVFSGGKVFFTASSTGTGNGEYELWATDGTEAGTYLVKDILPGTIGSRPNSTISAFGNKVLFSANNGTNGYELWQSDGTAAGTFLLQEFNTNGDGVVANTGVFFNFTVDFVYNKLGDKIIFFARSADKGLQLYGGSIASPYKYVNDNSTANDVFTTAIGNNANNGSQSAPYATITYALSQAQAGDTIYVDAGVFVEQVTIDKGITLIGAGSGATVVWKPAVINPPPGPFTEPGTIQTIQNIGDVHIRDMSVTGDDAGVVPIILQTGGSIKNCRLIGGSQGIFFRVDPAIKTAIIENNFIRVASIGINCQGSGLTTSLINNTIELTNPGFAAGVFAGLDFGPLVQFTAIGNSISNYNYVGFLANSSNTNITQNSIVGTGGFAIQQQSGVTSVATCNWFGTATQATIAGKINGSVTYVPFLTSGTDNNTANGFQPANATCSGQTVFYVNDNSRTSDVFTTAVGSNSNNGSPSAPFATLSYAITQAIAGDYIYVDAGTYTEQVTIDKGITIIGAGKDITSILKPAITTAPPGTFTEQGVIQTFQSITGDVHISSLSVTGDYTVNVTPIIIQSGGSVRNCKLQNGNQGVFVRIDPVINLATKTFVIDGNTIYAEYIAVNFAGTRLTATLSNNTIAAFNPGFSSGVWAGVDFGTLAGLTITGNIFNSYVSDGVFVNTNNGIISQNSFWGIGQRAINKIGGNGMNATCNWYGSADQNIVIPKITGNASYSPWLINGTDNSVAAGFQPLPGVCTGRQNKLYVNDNSLTGDVFTTAIGNNANTGIASAPLSTIDAAYSRAVAGDTIFVDAGTHSASGAIAKSITILGPNYLLSPNNPADPMQANTGRNAEAIITNSKWNIYASNINIEGLTFDPQSLQAIEQSDATAEFDNIKIAKNRFLTKSGTTVIDIRGKDQLVLVSQNYFITDNRFIKQVSNAGTSIAINSLDNVQINNNTFTVDENVPAAVRTQHGISIGSLVRNDNLVVNNNSVYRQNIFLFGGGSKRITAQFNNTIENIRFMTINQGFSDPSETIISDNTIADDKTTATSLSYSRINGFNVTSPNIFRAERNVITINVAASNIPTQALIAPTVNANTPDVRVFINENKLKFSGDMSGFSPSSASGIRLWQNIKEATIQNNEIVFEGINAPANALYHGIYLLHQGLQPGTNYQLLNNKVTGFKNSFYVQTTAGPLGNLPEGVFVNLANNSFTGDAISIENGTTGGLVTASCNWFGSAAAQNIINKVSQGNIDILPWLTNGTDNNIATGFQPVAGACDGYPTLIVLDNYSDVTCNGANNGTINITTSYGRAPFTYTWTKDGDPGFISHAEDLTNLSPGTYHLALVDGNGSTIYVTDPEAEGPGTIDVTITQPSLITATASGTNVSCFNGTNGTASVLAGGGIPTYTYLWSNGATTSSISDLAAGIYSVTVTDDNGCTAIANYEVTQPALLTASITNNSTGCYNAATAIPAGGAGPYSYLWSNGAQTAGISSVQPGTYNVTITDANGCTATASITLSIGEAFNPSASVTNVNCFGTSTGVITVTNANGIAPFTFSIDGGTFVPGTIPFSFTGLVADTFTVAVRDVNGCTGFVQKTITQPTQLVATLGPVQRTCNGSNTGSISASVTGGSPSYSYSWTGPGFSSTQLNISNLAAGTYILTVTDSKGCVAILNAVVQSYDPINVSSVIGNVVCKGESNGYIDLTVTGGTGAGFSYNWGNNAPTTQDRVNLGQGNYNVVITDIGSGCVLPQMTFTVGQAATLLKLNNPTFTDVRGCTPADLGTISASASGGVRPCLFKLGNGSYQVDSVFTGLATGTYRVQVKDAYGCEKSVDVTIGDDGTDQYERINNQNNNSKQRASVISVGNVINGRIASNDDDWFEFTTSPGGMTSYTVSVTHPSFNYTITLNRKGNNTVRLPQSSTPTSKTYLLGGDSTFQVLITGSTSLVCYSLLVQPPLFTRSAIDAVEKANKPIIEKLNTAVFPNPHRGNFGIKIESTQDGAAIVEVLNAAGQLVAEKRTTVSKGGISIVNFTNMNHNILFYRVRIGNETSTGKIIGPN